MLVCPLLGPGFSPSLWMHDTYPAGVMALREASSEGNISNYFLTNYTKVNAEVCGKVLEDRIIHWMKDKDARG